MSFQKSKNIGDIAEDTILQFLLSRGISCRKTDGRKHDIIIVFDSRDICAEIKFDKMSDKTKNIALEYYNSKSKKDSGFASSNAELWFHVTNINNAIWLTSPNKIKEFTKSNKPKRTVLQGGDGNADILLYPIDSLSLFAVNIYNMNKKELEKCLTYTLK